MSTLEQALSSMRDSNQWFLYRLTWEPGSKKFRKVPCALTGDARPIDASQPRNWASYTAARAALDALPQTGPNCYTLGYWLTADSGYFFLDIDKCVDQNRNLSALANELLALFPGALSEWSSSGEGVHIIGRATMPRHRSRATGGQSLELYHDGRGIAFGLTNQAAGCADTVHDAAIALVVSDHFAVPEQTTDSSREIQETGDDAEVICRMLSAKPSAAVVFGGKRSLADLWAGRCEKNSEADMALASHLAFWCKRNVEQMFRLMWNSGLVREKWHKHRTYVRMTVQKAADSCTSTLEARAEATQHPACGPRVRSAANLLAQSFKPVEWSIHGLVPEGVTILSGDPKIGKSWLVYQMCTAVAAGVPLWAGRPAESAGDALYLDLEGNDRRLQRRLTQLLTRFPSGVSLERLHYATEWPRAAEGVAAIADWLRQHPNCRLVVIDTISAFRESDPGRKSAYAHDYAVGEMLKPLAREFSCSIVLVMHNRKQAAGDFLHKISGTQGLTGGVDNVLMLERQRGQLDAALYVDGRDIEEPTELALRFNDGSWSSVGTLSDVQRSHQRTSVLHVLATKNGRATAKEIHQALPDRTLGAVKTLLSKMVKAGELRSEAGFYLSPAEQTTGQIGGVPNHTLPVTAVTDC